MRPNNEQRFTRLQAKTRAADAAERDYRNELVRQYGQSHWAPRGKLTRLAELESRAQIAHAAFFGFLAGLSPRDWSRSIPYHWIVESLTYADAISSGSLSTIPPAAYGYSDYDVRRFAAPIAVRESAHV